MSAAVGTDACRLVNHGLAELAPDLGALLSLLLGRVLRILLTVAWSHSGLTVTGCRSVTLRRIGLRRITRSSIHRLRAVSNWLHGRPHHGVSRRRAKRNLGRAGCVRAPLYRKYALDSVLDTSSHVSGPESWNADREGKASGGSLAEIGGS